MCVTFTSKEMDMIMWIIIMITLSTFVQTNGSFGKNHDVHKCYESDKLGDNMDLSTHCITEQGIGNTCENPTYTNLLYMYVKERYQKDHEATCSFSSNTTAHRNTSICEPPLFAISLNSTMPLLEFDSIFYSQREEIVIEYLVQEHNVGHLVIISQKLHSKLGIVYLTYVHPDFITIINPMAKTSLKKSRLKRASHDLGEYLHGTNNITELLEDTKENQKAPFLVIIPSDDYTTDVLRTFVQNAVGLIENTDILVVFNDNILKSILNENTICSKTDLDMYAVKNGVVFKPKNFVRTPLQIPDPPKLDPSKCNADTDSMTNFKTDLILMTKNRPMQALAFLKSFSMMQSGINKVWILYNADDYPFEDAYKMVADCVSNSLDIELVNDKQLGFGKTLLKILHSLVVDYVILGVDEMIWLQPLDIQKAACLLNSSDDVVTFQFRLGKDIHLEKIPEKHKRFVKVNFTEDVLMYYPYRLLYDFGYVLNVDGVMISKHDLLHDVKNWITYTKHPGNFENRWITKQLYTRVRQWHLMYNESHLVNNALTTDGRVIGTSSPKEGSYELLDMLMIKRKQIDYKSFIEEYINPTRTHMSVEVDFIDLECN